MVSRRVLRIAGGRGGCLPGDLQHSLGNCQFGFFSITCNLFHSLRDLLARTFAFPRKTGELCQHTQGPADRLDQLDPLDLANQAQAVDDVADGQVAGHLCGLAFLDQRQAIGAVFRRPAHQLSGRLCGLVRHALPQLRQKATFKSAVAHAFQQAIEFLVAQRMQVVPDRVGRLACGFAFGNLVSHPAQVFQQNDTQSGGQGPQLAQVQFTDILVGI